MQKLLSIVVPTYNMERFIVKALDSLFLQWQGELEVIVVDDGSSDNTVSYIKSVYMEKLESKDLVLVEQKNQGVSIARNVGIQLSLGKFVGFIDADDVIMENYVEILINNIRDSKFNNLDIIEFGYKVFSSSDDNLYRSPTMYTNSMFGFRECSQVLNKVFSISRWYPWTRIFKKELFDGTMFPSNVGFCEDMMTLPFIYEKAKNILVLKDALYGYRINPNGATLNIKPHYIDNLQIFYKQLTLHDEVRYDFLRFSIAYAIYSCAKKDGHLISYPDFITKDLQRIRWHPLMYLNLELRKLIKVCFPDVTKFLIKH